MLTTIRRRNKARRQRNDLHRAISRADRTVRDELVVMVQRQGIK